MKFKKTKDVLEAKRRRISSYQSQFGAAVSLITGTMNDLETINSEIQKEVAEIDEYTRSLEEAKADLGTALEKNNSVIGNLKKLINAD